MSQPWSQSELVMTNAIERAFENAAGPERDFCQVCCGPLSNRVHAPIIMLRAGEELGHCSACGRPVDGEGRSVCTVNSRGVVIVECIQCGSYP